MKYGDQSMAEVLISYSRKDKDFVPQLHEALNKHARKDWVDWKDIPPTAEWMKEIKSAVESSDSFVFVISQSSVASEVCGQEIEHAIKQNKRLIPIVREKVEGKTVPERLREIDWIFFRDGDDFENSFTTLIKAIDTDLDWVRNHTSLLTRVIEWESKERDQSFLLKGNDLSAAEDWLHQAMEKKPHPSALQTQYIIASRANSEQQKDVALKSIYKLTYDVPEMLARFLGTARMRKKFVTNTLQPLEELLKLNGRASEFLRDLSTNYRLLGDILFELNPQNKARKAFQMSVEYSSELVLQSPNEALYHRENVKTYMIMLIIKFLASNKMD